jgi:hypothetical protein
VLISPGSTQANTLQGRWLFHDFQRHFISEPPSTATVGQRFTYMPRVWDPELFGTQRVHPAVPSVGYEPWGQVAAHARGLAEPEVVFSATHLPPWMTLVNNMLLGVPDASAEDCEVRLQAITVPTGRMRKQRGASVLPPPLPRR